ncbi:TRAFAC clade GTPase domain-containing protein [Amycolatopsis alba]|uniref:Double-GTPase 2 domain-containing protein n=1 Tax=Amycolatopsis alba DSM 44262 TaxID=1125972 RepID=A0A229RK53_AMYAL|nr:hypothetical protein [Amycolatopsis alba]OXM47042.1 hypothetical protein CFP75_25540 [Amycolatopsis alba DSM 44262]
MQYLIGFALAMVALYFVIWLVVAGLMWFLLPGLIFAAPMTMGAGVLMAAGSAILTLVGRTGGPRLITPDDVVADKNALPKRRGDTTFDRDWAWPTYFAAQARADLFRVWRADLELLGRGWSWIRGTAADSWPGRIGAVLLFVPLWSGVSLGALAATTAILLVAAFALFAGWVVWALPTGLLRVTDQLIRRQKKASGSCQTCYHVTSLPVFDCPGCGKVHRDIRPGRLGGLWRRCGCGRVLPTSVLRMAGKTRPRCPRCGETLRSGATLVTDVRLPVFGPVSAGKTRLVYTGLLGIRDGVAANGGVLDFVDEDSEQTFDAAVSLISSGGDTVKTPFGELPRAVTARYTAGKRRALLHLFDAAGEFYADRDDNTALEFLDHAQGLVFVIDPFSIPWVRDQLGATSEVVSRAAPASEAPERVYHVTAKRLQDFRVATTKRRLAVAVVKADLLAGLPPAADLGPGNVREWLERAGLDNLVLSAEREFGEVEYFLVSSLAGVPVSDPRSPARPLAWVVAGSGLQLWPDTGPARAEPAEKEPEEAV